MLYMGTGEEGKDDDREQYTDAAVHAMIGLLTVNLLNCLLV